MGGRRRVSSDGGSPGWDRRSWRRPAVVLLVAVLTFMVPAAVTAARPLPSLPVQAIAVLGPFGQTSHGAGAPSGRVQDISVDPFQSKHILALSDAALWVSHDGGSTWSLLPGIERFGEWEFEHGSLSFSPTARGVVLLTSPRDDQSATQAGIYRSTDGGLTWSKPRGYQPPCGNVSPQSLAFDGSYVAVAAGCAVGISTDSGASWVWTAPDNRGGFEGVTWDVAHNTEACGATGIYLREAAHPATWQHVVNFDAPSFAAFGEPLSPCRITASPAKGQHVFFTAVWSAFQPFGPTNGSFSQVFESWGSGLSGWTVRNLNGGGHNNGRDVGIQTRPRSSGFSLYWGTTDQTTFETCTSASGAECPIGATGREDRPDPPWQHLGQDVPGLHADQSQIIFAPASPWCIEFVSSDGGIQRPAQGDCGGTTTGWRWSDSGIDSTEDYELGLTDLTHGPAHTQPDVYLATQDVGAFSLLSGAANWTNEDPGDDGIAIQSTPTLAYASRDNEHIYYSSDAREEISGRGLDHLVSNPATPFGSPWSGLIGNDASAFWADPTQLAELSDGTQVLADTPASGLATTTLWLTTDGLHWSESSASHLIGVVNGPAGAEVQAPTGTSGSVVVRDQDLLYLVRDVESAATTQPLLPSEAVGPYGVGDANHILAFGCDLDDPSACTNPHFFLTTDGGTSWSQVPALEGMVTQDAYGNHYSLDTSDPLSGQPTAVAIDPSNSRIMMVGTADAGVFQTGDGGRSWSRALQLPRISKLRFASNGDVYGATFGRGAFFFAPHPPTLVVSQRYVDNNAIFTVLARRASGKPIGGLSVQFVNVENGHRYVVGQATTNKKGTAQIIDPPTSGGYLLAVAKNKAAGFDLETQVAILGK